MSSPSPGASSEVPFTPRKEFIKDQPVQPNSFALLALSSSNCIRLYSFAAPAVASLSRLFEKYNILSFREDASQNLCEFALDGKPWANPKSVPTEKLLVDVIAIIYQCGYTYLSTIDYGREADDRLAMTFSRPAVPSSNSRTPTPLPHSIAPKHDSLNIPFAISFSSVTTMRVIAPPLHLTPAILQAVRGSWPRGVAAEKKVGENSYEFKLKGYKWFEQDTFATDSLRHILSLLTSLDTHAFSLLTSISLTNRSRVKDLWIFTGPAPEDVVENGLLDLPYNSVKTSPPPATGSFGDTALSPGTQYPHRRLATDPSPVVQHSPTFQHPRAVTESPQRQHFPPQSQPQTHLLRKPAPRAQIPVSVVRDSYIPDEPPILRANLPSTISTGVQNMTGIGASPNLIYPTSPFEASGTTPASPRPRTGNSALLLSSSAPSSPQKSTRLSDEFHHDRPSTAEADLGSKSPPLLGIGTFRDSAFSSKSEMSSEIPIKWTGPLKEEPRPQRNRVSSSGPQFPGGWQPSPVAEKSEDEMGVHSSLTVEKKGSTTPIHEMISCVESPEIVGPDTGLRKSEAALVGIIQSTSPAPPLPQRQNSQRKESQNSVPNGGQGWVLVNVENSSNPSPVDAVLAEATNARSLEAGSSSTPFAKSSSNSSAAGPPPLALDQSPSPAAKAIVIIDAMESKHKKSQSTANSKESSEGRSGVRRFFSLNKKHSKRAPDDIDAKKRNANDPPDGERLASNSIPRSNLRDRLRLIGTPEAARKEDKRRSID
ncbi:hypothetical protein BDZ97DRAFT_1776521 [Flammula alnicola]|nr:hypothetical protein BDZ97DRAFT_1776521 [Flammula alnicola]